MKKEMIIVCWRSIQLRWSIITLYVGMARLRSTLSVTDVVGRQRLRSATQQMMVVPRHRLSTVGRRAFTMQGPMVWNSLPDDLHAHSRTMSPLDSAWKPGFSLSTSMLSTLETLWQLCYINWHLPLTFIMFHYWWDLNWNLMYQIVVQLFSNLRSPSISNKR